MCVGDYIAFASGAATIIGIIVAYLIYRMGSFNDAADKLDVILRKERCGPHPFTNIDFSPFERVLTKRERIRFGCFVDKYRQTTKNAEIIYDPNNPHLTHPSCCWYLDANPIVSAIDDLLRFTKRK